MLLKNCTLLTLSPSTIEKADLRIEAGLIKEKKSRLAQLPGEEVIDLAGKYMLSGLVNAHTHLYSSLARGMASPKKSPKNFLEILQYIWWKLDRALDDESVYYSAIVRTTDGGTTWTPQYSGTIQTLHAVSFIDSLRGAAVGNGILLSTVDGGETWEHTTPGQYEFRSVRWRHSSFALAFGEHGIASVFAVSSCSPMTFPVMPQNNSVSVGLHNIPGGLLSLVMQWSYTHFINISHLYLQCSTDSTFAGNKLIDTLFRISQHNFNSSITNNLVVPHTVYYWHIGLDYYDSTGITWSATWKFCTANSVISGSVYDDYNRDSIFSSHESGIANYYVFLAGKDGGSTVTDSLGNYQFVGLDSGVYVISCPSTPPWSKTSSPQVFVNLPFDDTVPNVLFGKYNTSFNTINGYVFYDKNENGIFNISDSAVMNWRIRLHGATVNESTLTYETGYYKFSTLEAQQCSVLVVPPHGWEMFVPRIVDGYDFHFQGYGNNYSNITFAVHPIPVRTKIPILCHDNTYSNATIIKWGTRAGATSGIWGVDASATHQDFAEGEDDLPSIIPNTFDVRFLTPPGSPVQYGNGSWIDMRSYYSPAQADTYQIHYTTGFISEGDYPFTFQWDKALVRALYNGPVTLIAPDSTMYDMKALDSMSITNSSFTTMLLIASSPSEHPDVVPDQGTTIPRSFSLEQNYPNPFNPTTWITFSIPESRTVILRIYDITGREVETILNKSMNAGTYTVQWNAYKKTSGIYFCFLTTVGKFDQRSLVRKMLLLR